MKLQRVWKILFYETETYNYNNYLYVNERPVKTFTNKDKSQRFLTALILSIFVCLAYIGLATFGFLLFKFPIETSSNKFETVQSQS